jgi:hypothetical protein
VSSSKTNKVFVFGSNLMGIHGAGSAKEAHKNWGAEWGAGSGPTGHAYAIPTKTTPKGPVLEVGVIRDFVRNFLDYARAHPEFEFHCVRIGCGYAGYKEADIAPLFRGAPPNVHLPFEFTSIINPKEK